ncbi:hypothetical protein BDR03DRAFT_964519 [Suillus americanus]|nr:hypothetical protein BDR03DRAFT_964519 [Suillus americanus]
MPFFNVHPMRYPRVCCTASLLCRQSTQVCDQLCIFKFLYVKTMLMLLTQIRRRLTHTLHSARFFRPMFELQHTPDVLISTMTF